MSLGAQIYTSAMADTTTQQQQQQQQQQRRRQIALGRPYVPLVALGQVPVNLD